MSKPIRISLYTNEHQKRVRPEPKPGGPRKMRGGARETPACPEPRSPVLSNLLAPAVIKETEHAKFEN
jgi:hypothetical protein